MGGESVLSLYPGSVNSTPAPRKSQLIRPLPMKSYSTLVPRKSQFNPCTQGQLFDPCTKEESIRPLHRKSHSTSVTRKSQFDHCTQKKSIRSHPGRANSTPVSRKSQFTSVPRKSQFDPCTQGESIQPRPMKSHLTPVHRESQFCRCTQEESIRLLYLGRVNSTPAPRRVNSTPAPRKDCDIIKILRIFLLTENLIRNYPDIFHIMIANAVKRSSQRGVLVRGESDRVYFKRRQSKESFAYQARTGGSGA